MSARRSGGLRRVMSSRVRAVMASIIRPGQLEQNGGGTMVETIGPSDRAPRPRHPSMPPGLPGRRSRARRAPYTPSICLRQLCRRCLHKLCSGLLHNPGPAR
jgi:hypothetical protein